MSETERLQIVGVVRNGSPMWKITEDGRVLAYCMRESDAQRILAALARSVTASGQGAGEGAGTLGQGEGER